MLLSQEKRTVRVASPVVLRCTAVVLLAAVMAWLGRSVTVDDCYIYARYIQNAVDGLGLVFNKGEQVNALTSPLYCYLLLVFANLVHGHVLLVMRVFFCVFWLLSCLLAEALAPYAGILAAACGYFYFVRGMETPIFLFFIALALWLYREERWNWLPVVYVLLALTRFEGALLALVLFAGQLLRRKHSSLASWLPVPILIAGYLLFNYHWYGMPLPSSAGAKFAQAKSGYWGRWPFAFLHMASLKLALGWAYYLALPMFFLIWRGVRAGLREGLTWIWPALLFLTGLGAFCILENIPNYTWYYAPFLYLGVILAARGLPRGWGTQAVVWPLVLVLVISAVHVFNGFPADSPNPAMDDYARAGQWLVSHAPAGSRIAAAETGVIGWSAPHDYIIDVVGLTTPPNAIYTEHHQLDRWFAEDHPDYVVVHVDRPWRWETPVLSAPDYAMVPVSFGSVRLYARKALLASQPEAAGK